MTLLAAGDVIGMVLALAAILALHRGSAWAIALTWLFAAATLYDLIDSTIIGVGENLFDSVAGVTWLILTFYVPVLWWTLALVVWQLLSRRGEPLAVEHPA